MATTTPGVYTCQTCNALFTCLEYYQQHRRNHAECNGVKLLTCSHCPYSTDNSFHYNWHIMSHTGKPAHRCQVCSKTQHQTHHQTQATSPMKQEPVHSQDSISDEEPSACAQSGKRSVATATTDDLLLSSNLQSTPQQQNSCRMSSKGIMTSLTDHNNFYNLKTIDPSDLMDNKYTNSSEEGEEEEDDDEEEEDEEEEDEEEEEAEADDDDEEYVHKQTNRVIESEGEDDDEEDDDEEEEESEEEEELTNEFGVTCVDTTVQNTNNNSINNNIIINNINITNNNITNSSNNNSNNNKRVKTSDQSTGSGETTAAAPKPRGRGKGNRKSRVNAFFEGADGSQVGVEGIRRKFHCSHCGNGKSFKTKSHLQRHILTHTGEKPYHCNRCGSKFNQSSSLRNHIIAIHTKEYPHYCPNCGKGFLMPALLQKHLATSHRNK